MFKASECKNFEGVNVSSVTRNMRRLQCGREHCEDADACDQVLQEPWPEPVKVKFEPKVIPLKEPDVRSR